MTDARFVYLETQIYTATPQKLRLMLIEGAIRQAQLALEHWEQGRNVEGFAAIARCRPIVDELIGGVRNDGSPLTRQVTGIYAFVVNALTEAELQFDPARLRDVLLVLQEERETWQQVCQTLTEAPQAAAPWLAESREIVAPRRVDTSFSAGYSSPHQSHAVSSTSSGFSLEM